MKDSPYSRFAADQLILRDELAIDRTLLANERTLLAYLRSGVSLVIAGVSIMHFATDAWFWGVGVACVPSGVVATIVGVVKYRMMDRGISRLRKQFQAAREAEPGRLDAGLTDKAIAAGAPQGESRSE